MVWQLKNSCSYTKMYALTDASLKNEIITCDEMGTCEFYIQKIGTIRLSKKKKQLPNS